MDTPTDDPLSTEAMDWFNAWCEDAGIGPTEPATDPEQAARAAEALATEM